MMKKLLKLGFIAILLMATNSAFSQATVTIDKVPAPTIKINTQASDGATETDYQVTFSNIPLVDDVAKFEWFSGFKDATSNEAVAGGKTLKILRTDVDVIDNGDGTYNKTFVFTRLDLFGPSLINDQNVIYSGTGFPGDIGSNVVNLTVEPAPAVQIDIDSVELVVPTAERGSEYTVSFNYSSNVDITALRIFLWIVATTPGYTDKAIGSSAVITDLPTTNGVSTAASAAVVFPKATEIVNDTGVTWMLNVPPTVDNGGSSIFYQYRFRLEDESGNTGQTFLSGGAQKSFNSIEIQEITNDADTDGIDTFAVDGSNLDICPNTPIGEIGTIDTDSASETYGCSTNEQNELGVADFGVQISNVLYPNPAYDVITISNEIKTETYRIINFSGATVKTVPATGTLDVSGLSGGLYFLSTDAGYAKFLKL